MNTPAEIGNATHIADLQEDPRWKSMQEALRVSQERFEKTFWLSPDVLAITRLEDGLFREVNDSFCHTLQ